MERATIDPDVGQRLDHLPVTRLHCLAIGLCALGFAFDLFEIALGSALSAVFSADPNPAVRGQLSTLLASVYVGAAFGAPILGWIGDRYGRRLTLMGALLLMSVASLGGAASGSITELTVWRAIAGLALGGFPPLMIAYLTDMLPAGRRAQMIFVTIAIGSLGPAMGIFLIRTLVPIAPMGLEAWRWGFIAGGAGAGVVGLLFHFMPESPRWLHTRGRHKEARHQCGRLEVSAAVLGAVPLKPGMPGPSTAASGWRQWPLVATLFFLAPWSTVAFPLLTGAILTQKGFRLSDTLLYVGLSCFGQLAGTLLASLGIDRIGRRAALVVCATGMAACGWVFVSSQAPVWLIASSFGFGLVTMLFISVLNIYASELFPTATRATAISSAWALNRIGAACAPMLLLPLMASAGAQAMFGVIGASLLASMLVLAIAPPGAPGRAVN